MKAFREDALRFLLLQIVVGFGLLSSYQANDRAYIAATLDKHARLETQPHPQLIVTGGSNVAFGLDSELLGERLSGYAVIDLGLHAGVGLGFMLAEAEAATGPGDVVVVSPEYQHFARTQKDMLVAVLEQRPRSLAYVPARDVPGLLDRGITDGGRVLRESLWRRLHGAPASYPPYSRDSFNALGDVVAHRSLPAPERIDRFVFKDLTEGSVRATARRLNAFGARCRKRGGRAYLIWPPIPRLVFEQNRESLELIQAALTGVLEIPALNRPEDVAFDTRFFFDTPYHLTAAGARRRTEALAASLRQWPRATSSTFDKGRTRP